MNWERGSEDSRRTGIELVLFLLFDDFFALKSETKRGSNLGGCLFWGVTKDLFRNNIRFQNWTKIERTAARTLPCRHFDVPRNCLTLKLVPYMYVRMRVWEDLPPHADAPHSENFFARREMKNAIESSENFSDTLWRIRHSFGSTFWVTLYSQLCEHRRKGSHELHFFLDLEHS